MRTRKHTIDRLPNGSEYFFIKLSELKACQTIDCHFESDDEKFSAGNYFLTRSAVRAVADELREQFEDRIRSNRSARTVNEHKFIKATIDLADNCHLRSASADMLRASDLLLAAINDYRARKAALDAESKIIKEEVDALIRKSPKQ